jgi:hypothetical protein
MQYEKPQLAMMGYASDAIQDIAKGEGMKDSPEQYPSIPAYQADE